MSKISLALSGLAVGLSALALLSVRGHVPAIIAPAVDYAVPIMKAEPCTDAAALRLIRKMRDVDRWLPKSGNAAWLADAKSDIGLYLQGGHVRILGDSDYIMQDETDILFPVSCRQIIDIEGVALVKRFQAAGYLPDDERQKRELAR